MAALHRRLELGECGAVHGADRADGAGRLRPAQCIAQGLGLAALGYALWLEWFVAKSALRLAGGAAVAFVLLDLLLGIFIGGLVGRLSGG